MGVSRSFDNFTTAFNNLLRRTLVAHSEKKNIKRKKDLINKVELTKEQEAEIRAFFKEYYGKVIPPHWHRLYQSYTGVYRKDYFPEILFSTRLEPKTNPYHEAEFLDDKNWLPSLFAGIEGLHIPTTYGACVKGVCYTDVDGVLPKSDFLCRLKDVGKCVIKKTVDTSSGRDVKVCNIVDGGDTVSGKSLEEIVSAFGKNYIIQELVKQSAEIARLNETSFNTFRVMSYICDGEIHVCPIALRLGRNNATKDNIHYGGICVGVKPDGTLKSEAYSEYGEVATEHPDSHVVFLGYTVLPNGTKTLEDMARKLHSRVLHLGILSWDLGIDDTGNVVLIEMNSYGQSAWFCQMVNGEPLFGENTPKMLAMIQKTREHNGRG